MKFDVIVVGGGFSGLSTAYEISKSGKRVLVLEKEPELGGMAGSFAVEGTSLEKFYHVWYESDRYAIDLASELGLGDHVVLKHTNTGLFYANQIYRLSKPLDVLKFDALSLLDRVRLGILVLKARRVKRWMDLESLSAAEWIIQESGRKVYEVVWEPLLRGKFGIYADQVSAVWFWNKLILRGGSRSDAGKETLVYIKGGFATLYTKLRQKIEASGGMVMTNSPVDGLRVKDGAVVGVKCGQSEHQADRVVLTPALPIIADLFRREGHAAYAQELERIEYLCNLCLVLELDRSLSSTYWLNVNDATFPYVGIIEHTNFEPSSTYAGRHIVYLSKYLPYVDPMYAMSTQELVDFSLPHLKRVFPQFDAAWVLKASAWRERYAQPIVTKHYSQKIPKAETPLANCFIATMAQIYPEDRGTNFAIRDGRALGRRLAKEP